MLQLYVHDQRSLPLPQSILLCGLVLLMFVSFLVNSSKNLEEAECSHNLFSVSLRINDVASSGLV